MSLRFFVRGFAIAVSSFQHRLVFGGFCACSSGICLSLIVAAILAPFERRTLRAGIAIAGCVYGSGIRKREQTRFNALEIRSAQGVFVPVRKTDKQVMHFRYAVVSRRVRAEKF